MVGRQTWRKSAAFLLSVAACTAFLFTLGATQPQAGGDIFERFRDGVRRGIQVVTGRGSETARRPAVVRAESPRSYAMEMDRLARDRSLLRLPATDVDPLRDGGVPVDTRLPAGMYLEATSYLAPDPMVDDETGAYIPPRDTEYWLVQFGEHSNVELRADFQQLGGIEIVGFWPNTAYLVRVDGDRIGQMRSLPNVRWSGRFHPSHKIDARLREQLDAGDDLSRLLVDDRGMFRLFLTFYRDIHGESYRSLVESIPGVELTYLRQIEDAGAFMYVEVSPRDLGDALVQLAQLRDLASVALDEIPEVHNDHSVWYIQTGITDGGLDNYDVTARLFRLGITGQGLGGVIADDGLENDMCYFRYSANLSDVTYQTLDDNQIYPEGGTLADDRTRLRKVSAYIVFDGATAYSDEQHGTGTAGCMLGDNYGHATTGGSLAARPIVRDLGRLQNIATCEDPANDWTVGQVLRAVDADMVVDNPTIDDPLILNGFGTNVEHHDARDGMAPGANLVFFDIGSGGNLSGVLLGRQAIDTAWGYGATSTNHSYGGAVCQNCYTGQAPFADQGLWYNRMVNTYSSAGNDGDIGTGSIGSGFAQGKNVVTVGATERANSPSVGQPRPGENIASYSGRGPKSGGLLAPEIVVPGSVVTVATGGLAVTPEDGTGSGNNECLTAQGFVTGTSFSSPTAAGAALLVQQYFMDGWYPNGVREPANAMRPTNALTRAVMVNSTRNLGGFRTDSDGVASGHRPNFGQGWGAIRLDDTLYFQGDPLSFADDLWNTQRARMIVLTDTPNGLDDTGILLPEPGGQLRNQLVQNFQPAITDGAIHEFPLNIVKNPADPMDPADELRISMCYADARGTSPTGRTTVNDLDLEAISPSGVVYRTNPTSSWDLGYTVPSADQEPQEFVPLFGFTDFADRDPNNTCENIFIAPENVEQGTWNIRVIGYMVPGNGDITNNATPNFVNDQTPNVDTDVPCDGVPDIDSTDQIFSDQQGYALLVSGNFTTTQGTVALNRTSFLCEDEALSVTVSDSNGDDAPEPPCTASGEIVVEITTTVADAGFTADLEIETLVGSAPLYQTAENLPIQVVSDPALVVHGDGIIQIAEGQNIVVEYEDANPCGGRARATASVACRPNVSDQGFLIDEGCDLADASNPMSEVRPDNFMDADELNVYTVRFSNNGGTDLTDAVVSLRPDPEDPLMQAVLPGGASASTLIRVVDSPRRVGLAPPGRISDTRFRVQMGPAAVADPNPNDGTVDGIPPQYPLDFIVCVTSPADGLLYPDCFTQTQSLESDIESFRYDTRDPNGELYGLNLIERQIAGPPDSLNPNDYIRNTPMWFDPSAICNGRPCAEECDLDRDEWDAANLANPGSGTMPHPDCFAAATGNPVDPWDFDEDDELFEPAIYDGDPNQVGPPGATGGQEWFWKNAAMGGGGCGWEDEVIGQLDSMAGTHPDVPVDPWGIWHTGAINASTAGPYPTAMPQNTGVPANEDESDPNYTTILWDPDGAIGPAPTNENGEWCDSYISNTALENFYRSFLKPPRLHRVHRSDPEFRVEFREWRTYTRMDGHTIDGDNLTVAGWSFSNEPIDPVQPFPLSYTWGQFQTDTLIFSDRVRENWADDDTFVDENLRTLNPSFSDFTYEDFFGPAEDSWDFALSWGHLHFDRFASDGQYGWGIDDVSFVWTESRDVPDRSDCGTPVDPRQPAFVYLGETRYNSCDGTIDILVQDRNQTLPEIAVCVTSSVEDFEVALLRPTGAPGEYAGSIPFNADPRFAADGTISILAGQVDVGRGADTVRVEYDPSNVLDHSPDSDPWEICDWLDVEPPPDGDGRNDDVLPAPDGDGIPDAEDNQGDEVADTAAMNCTSGLIYAIKHELTEAPGCVGCDGDRFADNGETMYMSLQLASQLGANLEDVEVTISTDDDTVCILQDTVVLDQLPGSNELTDTPVVPGAAVERAGFLFAVPTSVRTTDIEQPQQVTFRVDVKGVRQDNLNEFTTFGDGFNAYLPVEMTLFLDLNEVPTTADYQDPVTNPAPRPQGEYLEGFEGLLAFGGYDHPRAGGQPGWGAPLIHDARTDSRYGANLNNGFCPECTDCDIPEDCEYAFDGDPVTNFTQWAQTGDWAFTGSNAMKFGEPAAGPMRQDQAYEEGQYTSIESPPLYLANDDAITPELSFRHIADFWQVTFTGGLSTVLGSGVLEMSANPGGLVSPIQQFQESEIRRLYPMDSFRRVYPYQQGYDSVTDALNACRTLYCGYHHPVFGRQGDPLNSSGDENAGSLGGTWAEVRVDLSDFKGMQVVFRWTVAVLQDLDVQNGRIGWLIDDIRVEGVSTVSGCVLDPAARTVDPCGIVPAFQTTSADCVGEEVFVNDRHTGLGMFDSGTGAPFPIEYEWTIGGSTVRGFEGDPAVDPGCAGCWRGSVENPIIRLDAIGLGAGSHTLTVNYYQNGMLVGTTSQQVVYKDAPVPAFMLVSDGPYQGAQTRFEGSATVLPSPDPARELTYIWDFGDGSAIDTSGPNPNHVFEEPCPDSNGDGMVDGSDAPCYDVTLCVRDEDGCESCTTDTFLVVDAPAFTTVLSAVTADCADPSTPGGSGAIYDDGNPDFNEYVTIDLSFTNEGATATDVIGYLSTSEADVEIVQGTADFGTVMGGGLSSAARPFTFIYRDDSGMVPTCLVVPFTLTVVGNGGTVVQEVPFSLTMGTGVDISDVTALDNPGCSFNRGDSNGGCTMTKPGVAGCLDGMRFVVDVSGGGGLATIGDINITITSPNGTSAGLHFGDGLDVDTDIRIECYFDVDDTGPIMDSGGAVICAPGSDPLPQVTFDTIIETFTGEPLDGPGQWRIDVTPRIPISPGGDPASPYFVNEAIIELEGKESTDLEIAVEGACSSCLTPSAPIYTGLSASCVPGAAAGVGALTWRPASDVTTCGGDTDLSYELYVSSTPGQLGDPATILGPGQTCEMDCPTGDCAFPRGRGASTWVVCDITNLYWTVVVSDDMDASTRVPNASAPADAVPMGFQSVSTNCLEAPDGPTMTVTRAAGSADLELWVQDPAGAGGRATIPALRPGTGTGYTVFRGSLASIWSASEGDPAGYDHATIQCSEPGPSIVLGPEPAIPGEPGWYYLLPSNGAGGCGGLGFRGTPRPGSGLSYTEGRPNGPNDASCPPLEADCLP